MLPVTNSNSSDTIPSSEKLWSNSNPALELGKYYHPFVKTLNGNGSSYPNILYLQKSK